MWLYIFLSGSSDGKESACSEGDLDLIFGLGRFPREGNGNLFQYSCREIPWTEEPGRLQSMGSQRDTPERLTLSRFSFGHNVASQNRFSLMRTIFCTHRKQEERPTIFLPGRC